MKYPAPAENIFDNILGTLEALYSFTRSNLFSSSEDKLNHSHYIYCFYGNLYSQKIIQYTYSPLRPYLGAPRLSTHWHRTAQQ